MKNLKRGVETGETRDRVESSVVHHRGAFGTRQTLLSSTGARTFLEGVREDFPANELSLVAFSTELNEEVITIEIRIIIECSPAGGTFPRNGGAAFEFSVCH